MNYYLRFKKWVEQERIQKNLDKFVVIWIILIVIVSIGLSSRSLSGVLGLSTRKDSPSIILPSPTPIATKTTVPCGPGQHSGQYVYLETASDCQNYTDCGFTDGSWKLMKKEDCTIAQKQDIVPRQNNTSTKIDCTGPDGKHFQATQKECNEFNAAWGNKKINNMVNCKLLSGQTIPTSLEDCNRYNAAGNSTQGNIKVYDSLEDYEHVSCTTEYGTFTSYGKTHEEAVSSCSHSQAYARSLKESAEQSLQRWKDISNETNEIVNRTFQPATLDTSIVVPTSPQIVDPTPKTCTSGMVNSYGAVGAISVPCK